MKNKIEGLDNIKPIKSISFPTESNLSIATNRFLEILSYSGEISVRDTGILSKKYNNVISTHTIPRLSKAGYITRIDKTVLFKKNDFSFDINKSMEKEIARPAYILTEQGREALAIQNKGMFGYSLSICPSFSGVYNIAKRNINQEISSALVLCDLLNINSTYCTHPHIYNELDYECGECENNLSNTNITIKPNYLSALKNFGGEETVGYTFRVFQNTNFYDDHIKGIQARMFLCVSNTLFFLYIMDNKSIMNRKLSLEFRNEKPKKNNLLISEDNSIFPSNYCFNYNGPYCGNAIFCIESINQIANIFDIKRKPRHIYDSYNNKKEVPSRKNIQAIVNMLYDNSYLVIRNLPNLYEHFKMLLLPYEVKAVINSFFFSESDLSSMQTFYEIYYTQNNYARGIKKFGVNTRKFGKEYVAPVDAFTHEGKAVFYMWELDIAKIHKAIYDNVRKGKIFCCFDDQVEIFTQIFRCYQSDKDTTYNIKIKSIDRKSVIDILKNEGFYH